jgi:hypothetical protein
MLGFGGNIAGIIHLILAIWVIYDVVTVQKKMDSAMKVVWIIVGVLVLILGPVLYYFVGKK